MPQSSARRRKTEGTRQGNGMAKVKRRKQGHYRQLNQIEITWGVPAPLAVHPLARPFWEIIR